MGCDRERTAGHVRDTTALPRVDIYGDSVTWESEYFMVLALGHRADVHMHVYPGAQICQWFSDMRSTSAAHPSMVLITEGLWGSRDCDHTTNLVREAQDDAGTAAAIFAHSRVVFSADPVVLNSTEFVQTMGYKNYPKLLAAFREAAKPAQERLLQQRGAVARPEERVRVDPALPGRRNGFDGMPQRVHQGPPA